MQIGVDTGGTFTDFVVFQGNGAIEFFKLRSDPADPAAVILQGIARASPPGEPGVIIHGSTVATNALLERKGARTAFVASPGFRDILRIGRQNRSTLYALRPENRVNLVPPELSFEWTGNPEDLRTFASAMQPESIAICLLRSFRDPAKEIEAEQALKDTRLYVSRSSAIAPEFREYERASTTVLNAYVGPLMERYLSQLAANTPLPLHIMQSSGGLLSASEARCQAVRTILSGPAGGVVGARAIASQTGWSQAIAFDMGGTSTDVSVVEHPFRFATEAWIEGIPLRIPLLDIHTVGAGGGSLASVDAGGRLRVGPESAGAKPGPACYGIGDRPTVTDAHVVLGRIVPERFLDGSLPIDAERARVAVSTLAKPLGLSVREAASAIVRIANSNMERALRVVTIERGLDPRDFPLVAFGGCGGLHACELAEGLGIATVVFPPYAGALSALGMLLAAHTRDYAAGTLGVENPGSLLPALIDQARTDLPGADLQLYADIRYAGQSYELTVEWDETDPRGPFERAYRQTYGFDDAARAIEIVAIRVRATLPVNTEWFHRLRPPRRVAIAQADGSTLFFDYGSTVFIPQGWSWDQRESGAIVATRE